MPVLFRFRLPEPLWSGWRHSFASPCGLKQGVPCLQEPKAPQVRPFERKHLLRRNNRYDADKTAFIKRALVDDSAMSF